MLERIRAPIEPLTKNWSPELIARRSRYFISDSSVISINNDTTAPTVSIQSAMVYSISTIDSNNYLILTGHLDSLDVNRAPPTSTKLDTGKTSNLHAVISKRGRVLNRLETVPINCSVTNAPNLSRIADLLVALPLAAVRVGDKWADTSSTISCHGKIPLTHMTIRDYELLNPSSCNQANTVQVRETVIDTLTGSSTDKNNYLSTRGFGTASSMLCLERSTGTLVERNGQSRLDLTITTFRGVFPFTQISHTHIELR